ncbi:hypothetical protein DRJ16_01490 [Candidatus Woesearchaeota archaeon]|nr:MAG: hypothetical protein DRJ16_01490 [Candidatus Woesearchaeota archaeon]
MEMNWYLCQEKGFAKKITSDKSLANSLVKTAENQLRTESTIPLSEQTLQSKIILVYSALREILEAIAILHGWKIYNHECFYFFLNEVLKRQTLAEKFNLFRKIRNKICYYGKSVSLTYSENLLSEMRVLIKTLKKEFLT